MLSEDQIEAIHGASLRVLRDFGMKVLSPKARALYEGAGASADDDTAMVRFDSDMIEEYMALAPSSYTIKARNPSKSLTFGGNVINFGLVGGPSFVSDLDRGRRAGDYEDVFYVPIVSDWRNFETWFDSGALSAARRANVIWKKLLASYEPPPIDPGVDEALREYVVKRKHAIEAGEVALEH